MPQVIHQLISSCDRKLPKELWIDFSTLDFTRPSGVVFISNLIQWLDAKGTKVVLEGLSPHRQSNKFLDDALFFEQHLGTKLRPYSSPRPTTIPLKKVTQAESHGWLEMDLTPWLSNHFSVPESSLREFRVCLSELFNNIADHTCCEIGSIFCQYYPNEGRILISVADFGAGIPSVVRRFSPKISSIDAILKATEDGFTTKTSPRNRGAGLHYLLQNVVLRNGGSVTIYSHNGIVSFKKEGERICPHPRVVSGFSPGTLFDIEFRKDTIEVLDDEEEDFEW
ncbi:ATP-binding region, ATPase-like [Rhodospirillum rubrum ATCC 11170]|uniref:ATP-binding region, ATPase-like n=2 Tax=Rhodospirillum rubrum TaxID=1085 RepID=Q2RS16_RHORT|nr:ATP-binding region, ATPase-like [Rhodospirillum rubrum ATCC 11170]MBK5954707.1 ATP-binding protein [Rhodospirillum rubrum]HAP99118.1 ATP-binding protein [Rhodospirillum rubrum]HCF18321.1 ATP-binding protein [Rhodospirillum rubrum]